MIDFNFSSPRKASKGTLLIAEPFADDEYFQRSVVLLCEHESDGSFGLVLNNFVTVDLNQLTNEKIRSSSRVSIGGPVDTDLLFFLHGYGDKIEGSHEVAEGLFFSGDFEQLIQLLSLEEYPEQKARFFLGISSWAPNQLEDEIKNNFWVAMDLNTVIEVFKTDDDELWSNCLNELGGRFSIFRNFPIDPHNN